MLTFRNAMFFGKSYDKQKKRKKLLDRLKAGKMVGKGVTMITYAQNGTDLFDLIEVYELLIPARKKQDFYVLGLAASKDEAIELVQDMIMEVYRETGDFDVRKYFGEDRSA